MFWLNFRSNLSRFSQIPANSYGRPAFPSTPPRANRPGWSLGVVQVMSGECFGAGLVADGQRRLCRAKIVAGILQRFGTDFVETPFVVRHIGVGHVADGVAEVGLRNVLVRRAAKSLRADANLESWNPDIPFDSWSFAWNLSLSKDNSDMKRRYLAFSGLVLASLLAGCASAPTALSPVGPAPASRVVAVAPETSRGFLEVHSATEKSIPALSDDPAFAGFDSFSSYVHSGYEIRDADGKKVEFVANHACDMDGWPDRVSLDAGAYRIVAQSTWCGQVSVPIVIERGTTTVVNLDNNWWPPANTAKNQLVYLSNGEAVGWSSSSSKSTE